MHCQTMDEAFFKLKHIFFSSIEMKNCELQISTKFFGKKMRSHDTNIES